jgi:hypothetical protein
MEIYLEPRDITAGDAQKVLDFLNAVATAEEIATAVEFPGELDVGLRVGARILARRAQLGKFTSLQQVADVPQVGPERFTEIVVGLARVHLAGLATVPLLAELQRQLRELQDELAALRAVAARPVVSVQPLVEAPFLGETVPLVVTVVDAEGEPAVDAAVDLVASWGRLQASDGYSVDEGAALTVRTDIFGRADATLTPPTSEDLRDVQQAALETSLATLDNAAPSPAETIDGLRELARQYRWEAAADLRHAVDVYFRDFRPRLLDTVNHRDYLARWSYLESTVTASAVATTAVKGAATLTVRFTDWLGAWLETYLTLVEEDSGLGSRLSQEAGRSADAGEILEGVHRRVGEFVESQRGVAGAYAAERVAERSMLGFLDQDVPKLPLEARLELFPALKSQSSTVAKVGATAFRAIEQARGDVRKELRRRVPRDFGGIFGDLLGSQFTEFEAAQSRRLEERLAGFEAAQELNLERRVAPVERELAGKLNTADFSVLRGRVVDIERRFGQ